ncbi:IS4 family transposase [Puniceicoccus vermicola]|uniref:IS4 family transposase n=1 Tax=Puniceicoccus vermicola TaxID=388746 RepID=UPI00339B66E9
MQQNNLFLPGFHRAFGRSPKSALKRLEDSRNSIMKGLPGQLPYVFEEALPLESIPKRSKERDRGFSSAVTVWHMISQGMGSGTLRAGLVEINATLRSMGKEKLSSKTGGLCQARQRLPESTVCAVHERVLSSIDLEVQREGGRTLFVDGTGFQLCDTHENQLEYPQPTNQKPGCGFPVMQQVALIDAHSGAVVDSIDSTWRQHEGGMFQIGPLESVRPDDTLVADTAYCSFWNFALIRSRRAHGIMELHQARKRKFPKAKDEYRTLWSKPKLSQCPEHIDDAQWQELPQEIEVRYIRSRFERKGFRPVVKVIATTDLETPPETIQAQYTSRWDIELCFRDIKITMGLDFIRAKSASMARKLYGFGLIAHNLIRWQMLRACRGASPRQISFTGAREALRRCCELFRTRTYVGKVRLQTAIEELIHDEKLPLRPGRHQPRVKKRRPKKFQLMTKPRHQMVVSPSRRKK